MVFLAPINMKVFSIVSRMRREVLKFSDLRVKMMNEILTGVRIIKFYAWERPFGSEVAKLRGKEMDALTKLAYTVAVGFSIILLSTPIIQPILVFSTYVKTQDTPLSAATAFTTVALFNIMRFPFAFLPMGLLQYIQSRISLKRLERYLSLPELGEYIDYDPSHVPALPAKTEIEAGEGDSSDQGVETTMPIVEADYTLPGSVTIDHGTFSWVDPDAAPVKPVQDEQPQKKRQSRAERRASRRASKQSENATSTELSTSIHSLATSVTSEGGTTKVPNITLKDISCRIPSGSLVAVVGAVGSGKSSLLSAILGEMEPIKGSKVYLPGLGKVGEALDATKEEGWVSYCTQSPWVVNDTLRGNILFGREFDPERYEAVLQACALKDDLAVLPAGDMTEIGERGINLSGGQKARVSLARAMYSATSKLLLLHDPLSAVDAHVGEHIFREAISGPVSQGMTRILVTHHVHVLSRCDHVVIMERGHIKHQGAYSDLIAQGVDFAGAVDISKLKKVASTSNLASISEDKATEEEKPSKEPKDEKHGDEAKAEKTAEGAKNAALMKKRGQQLVKEEEREEGEVAGDAYIRYARAGGLCLAAAVVVFVGLGRLAEVMSSFWLARWAERTLQAAADGDPFSEGETTFHLGVYSLLGFLGICGLGECDRADYVFFFDSNDFPS